MTDVSTSEMFYAAPFAVDGELVGVGQWRTADLSPRWFEFCRQLLTQQGVSFSTTLPGPLHRLELKWTSAEGAAIATYHVAGQLAASAVFLRGVTPKPEQEVLAIFVESLRRTDAVQRCQVGQEPFQSALGLKERPLHIVVAWGNQAVDEEDCRLVTELGNHMAGAFLCGP